jgi:large subunit ribosomal protein L25
MKHKTPEVNVKPRDKTGTLHTRRLRSHGRLPGVIYGHKQDPLAISVDEKEILNHLSHGAHVMELKIEGGSKETVLVKDLQFGYLGDNVIHVDFARVDLEEEVTVQVHLNFRGKPLAAEKDGAILSHAMTELEVICRVNAIPEEIRVDLTVMGEDTRFTVGQLILPPGVRATANPDALVTQVTFIKQEEEVAVGEEAEVAGADAGEPEVITEAKDEEKKDQESS